MIARLLLRLWRWSGEKAFDRLRDEFPAEWADCRFRYDTAEVRNYAKSRDAFLREASERLLA